MPMLFWSARDQIVMGVDPAATASLWNSARSKPPRGAIIDVLDGGLVAQSGLTQACGKPAVACRDNRSVLYQRIPKLFADLALSAATAAMPASPAPSKKSLSSVSSPIFA
jgi:hypothetical protein